MGVGWEEDIENFINLTDGKKGKRKIKAKEKKDGKPKSDNKVAEV